MHQQLAVLGSPIGHSQSPLIHRAAYAELGSDWDYSAIQCETVELQDFLETRSSDWRGLSLTMPLKEEAYRLAAVRDSVAMESGVVNTMLRLPEGFGWAGFNTDVGGLAAAMLGANLDARHTLVIGSGATAVSAILAARRLGARRVSLLARNTVAAEALLRRFSGSAEDEASPLLQMDAVTPTALQADPHARDVVAGATLVVSTVPGAAGSSLAVPDLLTRIPLFDVAYEPWPSPLAMHWRRHDGEAHAGLGMLVQQALLQIRIFHHGDPGTALPREDDVLAVMQRALDSASMGE